MNLPINGNVRQAIFRAYRGRCQYCGSKTGDDFQVDHIAPRSAGGGNSLTNYTLSCRPCNQKKGAAVLPVRFRILLATVAERKRSRIEALIGPPRRPGPKGKGEWKPILLKVLVDTLSALDTRAEKLGLTRTALIERAIERELQRKA